MPAAYTVSGARDVAEVVVFSVVNDEGDVSCNTTSDVLWQRCRGASSMWVVRVRTKQFSPFTARNLRIGLLAIPILYIVSSPKLIS